MLHTISSAISQILYTYLMNVHPQLRSYLAAFLSINTATWLGIGLLPIFISHKFGMGKELVSSLVLSIVPGIFLSPFIGILIKKNSPSNVLIFTNIIKFIVIAMMPFLDDFYLFQVIIFLSGLVNPFIEASLQTLRSYVTPMNTEIQINSLIQGSSRTIKIIAPALVALLAIVIPPEKILFLISFMHLLAVFIFFKLNSTLKKIHMDLVQVSNASKFCFADLLEMFKDFDKIVMKNRLFSSVFFPSICYMITLGATRLYLFWHTTDIGMDENQWGLLLSAQGAGAVIGSIFCGTWVNRLEKKISIYTIFFYTSLIEGLLLALLIYSTNIYTSFAIVLIASIPEAVAYILYFSISQRIIEKKYHSALHSFSNPLFDVAYAIGILSGGLYTSKYLTLNAYWIFLVSFSVLPLFFFLKPLFNQTKQDDAQ